MKDFTATVVDSWKNQLEQSSPIIWLISLKVPSEPPTRIRITNFNAQVARGVNSVGDPLIYSPFPIAIGDFRQTSGGDLPSTTINIANADLQLKTIINQYKGLIGQEIVIRWVPIDDLQTPEAEGKFVGSITGCNVDAGVISFTYGARNLQKASFPRNRYISNHCQWRFGTEECGYSIPASGSPPVSTATNTVGGGFDFCPRTLEACEERGEDEDARGLPILHPKRFGGYPGIQRGNQ